MNKFVSLYSINTNKTRVEVNRVKQYINTNVDSRLSLFNRTLLCMTCCSCYDTVVDCILYSNHCKPGLRLSFLEIRVSLQNYTL